MTVHRLTLLAVAGAVALIAGQPCLAPDAVFKLRSVSDPQLSPDGRAAAFSYSWIDINTDTSYSTIRLLKNGSMRTLHEGMLHERSPRWSPDGKSLAYVSDRTGRTRIHILDPDSGTEKVLSDIDRAPSDITWSPDGTKIAFYAFVEGKSEWNPAMPERPAGAKWAPASTTVTTVRWTMDGSGVMRPGSTQLFVAPVVGGLPKQISFQPFWHTSYFAQPELAWAADGRSILAPAVKAKEGWTVYRESVLYRFPLDGGEPAQIGPSGWHQHGATVSPDGKYIAFSGYQWKGQSYHVSHLYVTDENGKNSKVITGSLDRDVAAVKWSPDSRHLWFLLDDSGNLNLHSASLDGTTEALTHGDHRINALSIARNGRALAVITSPLQPGELVEFDVSAPEHQKVLFNPNSEYLGSCHLSAPEEIRYSSFDGWKVEGWLLKPQGFDASKKYPLLVSIHGGPHASYGNSFAQELQMFADHGYVVLYLNPRGSTGYGEEFARVIQYKWPGDDIKDILSGVDTVLRSGYIDPARMAVTGGSGGGLMTTWMITQTDRFRASVAWWPVTNWFTHIGLNDNGVYVGNVFRKGTPWEQPEDYMQHSPLFQVAKVKTPTMLITGDEDWRVPEAQSGEFYRALKTRGIDTVLVRVPGESHGVLKHPSHRMEVMVNTFAWLDRYIQPGPQ